MSLDFIGQARMLYEHVATLKNAGSTEDSLVYFRTSSDFRHYTLLELPHNSDLVPPAAGALEYHAPIMRN